MAPDRSSGWKNAKHSGHKYEQTFCERVVCEDTVEYKALRVILKSDTKMPISADPELGKKRVPSVIGRKAQSKADAILVFPDKKAVGVSIKKDGKQPHGQVLLCKMQRFLEVIAAHGAEIDKKSLWALSAFLGETSGSDILSYAPLAINRMSDVEQEVRQNRLFASTLSIAYPDEYSALIRWFEKNMQLITDICFRVGFASPGQVYAELIYFSGIQRFIYARELVVCSAGTSVGLGQTGSTILFPWGYLQTHRPRRKESPVTRGAYQLQFHWHLRNIQAMLGKCPGNFSADCFC
jgi:hypothetical protein